MPLVSIVRRTGRQSGQSKHTNTPDDKDWQRPAKESECVQVLHKQTSRQIKAHHGHTVRRSSLIPRQTTATKQRKHTHKRTNKQPTIDDSNNQTTTTTTKTTTMTATTNDGSSTQQRQQQQTTNDDDDQRTTNEQPTNERRRTNDDNERRRQRTNERTTTAVCLVASASRLRLLS